MFRLAMIFYSVHAALQLPGYINPEEHKWEKNKKQNSHRLHSSSSAIPLPKSLSGFQSHAHLFSSCKPDGDVFSPLMCRGMS